jgi:hypothetical protein
MKHLEAILPKKGWLAIRVGPLAAPLLAGVLVSVSQLLGWHGVDYAAQIYRVDSFRANGLPLWDFQWYGGNWTLDYSTLFPPMAAFLGVATVTVLSAAGATLAFDRLAVRHFGWPGRLAALIFAAGTVVQASIGQLPFLCGEAFGMGACWAASRGRWLLASLLAMASTLTSPLAGGFVVIVLAAWLLFVWRAASHRGSIVKTAVVVAAAGLPVAVTAVLFPGAGAMPYPVIDYAWEMVIAFGLWVAATRNEPVIRCGLVMYAAAATFAVAVPSPIGGNIGRLGDVLALPLAAALLLPRWRAVLPLAAVPLLLSQWSPAWGAITSAASQPSTHAAYFAPLVAALKRFSVGAPAGRVEVVPTRYHWEAAYVAPVMPLARGWERQLDVADNPIFYHAGALDARTYSSWLVANGVTFVAVPDAPLDFAGEAEAKLVSSGAVPGLQRVWQSPHWRLYRVSGSQGIVDRPDRLVSAAGGQLVVDAPQPGAVLIRIRYSSDWTLAAGSGCISRADQSWISVDASVPEQFKLTLSVLTGGQTDCET